MLTEQRSRSCQKQSLTSTESKKLEIPETPEIDSSMKLQELLKSSASAPDTRSVSLPPATEQLPLTWFNPRLAASKSKIKQKKLGQVRCNETSSSPAFAAIHQPPYRPNTVSCQNANSPSQTTLLKADSLCSPMEESPEPAPASTDVQTVPRPPPGMYLLDADNDEVEVEPNASLFSRDEMGTSVAENDPSSKFRDASNLTADAFPGPEVEMDIHPEPESDTLFSDATRVAIEDKTQTRPKNWPSLVSDSHISPPLRPVKKHTNRQLARIALVAANGMSLTTSQILFWIAGHFSYVRVGEGSWENGVRSTLSHFSEFTSTEIAGAYRGKKLYR